MGLMGETIATAGRRARGFAERAWAGIPAEKFARKPIVGGAPIETNHPAFIYGHLCLYPARIAAGVGGDQSSAATPPAWMDLFKAGSVCRDDPEGRIYPRMDEITRTFLRTYDAALEAVEKADDAIFARPLPDENYRQHFPTIGVATLVYCCSHLAMHMGQVSAWRRCMGLPPVAPPPAPR